MVIVINLLKIKMATKAQEIESDMMAEYDGIISEMQQQIDSYRVEIQRLVTRVESVTTENECLHAEIKNAYELQLSAPKMKGNNDINETLNSDMEISLNLTKCKSDLIFSKRELEQAQRSCLDLQRAYDKLSTDHQQVLESAKNYQSELAVLRNKLNNSQKQTRDANQRNVELQSQLDTMKLQLMKKSTGVEDKSSDKKSHSLVITNAELESRHTILQEQLSHLTEKKSLLEIQLSSFQDKIHRLESREHMAVNHVKESMVLLETALAEKEQADIKEQQYLAEIKHLQQKVSIILDEAGSRTKKEVEKVTVEYNKKIDLMASEIQNLERECSEKQSLLEKIQREKDELSQEFKKGLMNHPNDQKFLKDALNEVNGKLLLCERNRDEVLSDFKLLQTTKSKLEANLSDEQHKNSLLAEDLKLQRQQNQENSQRFRHEVNTLREQCNLLQEKVTNTTEELKNMSVQHEKQLKKMNEEYAVKERQLQMNLKYAQETQQKMSLDFKQALLHNQQATNKWQRETYDLNAKFEKSLADMTVKLTEAKRNNKDLHSKLNQLNLKNKTLNKQLAEQENKLTALNERVHEEEELAEQRRQQIALLVGREKKTMKQKQQMHHLLHKTRLQFAQNLRFAIVVDWASMIGSVHLAWQIPSFLD
jgi:chromosome segregation ATPase